MTENLNVESLARAIHEDEIASCMMLEGKPINDHGWPCTTWDAASEKLKLIRREQARRMMERFLR
jgi:hypothetical protein